MTNAPSRREFLDRSARLGIALSALSALPSRAASVDERLPGNPVITGLIGCGRRGRELLLAAIDAPMAVTIVCDVDAVRGQQAAELAATRCGRRPAITSDWRDIVEDPGIEAVIIASPDHWHLVHLSTACRARKDVYVEAPMARTANEARLMMMDARENQRVVQVGFQHRSSSSFIEAARIARSNNLGPIAQTRSWTFANVDPLPRQEDASPPDALNYDRWLGPAPKRAYNPARIERFYHWWDYGHGEMGLWNVHLQDIAANAMQVTLPRSVMASGGNYGLKDFRETPDTLEVVFDYDRPQGAFQHVYSLRLSNAYAGWGPSIVTAAGPFSGLPIRSGVQLFGANRTLHVDERHVRLLPADEDPHEAELRYLTMSAATEPASQPATAIDPATLAHVRQFARCVRTRQEPSAPVESGVGSTLTCQAATISYQLGRRIYIDPKTQEFFTDAALTRLDQEAEEMKQIRYRAPYGKPK